MGLVLMVERKKWIYVIGVDQSMTSTGLALLRMEPKQGSRIEYVKSVTVKGSTENQDAHLLDTEYAVADLVEPNATMASAWYGAVELVHMGPNKHIAIRLAYECGAARLALLRRFGVGQVSCYNPKSWRRWLGFKNLARDDAKKAAIAFCAKPVEQGGLGQSLPEDEAEACCIAVARLREWVVEQQAVVGVPLDLR